MSAGPIVPLSLSSLAAASKRAAKTQKDVWLSDQTGYRGVGRLVARVSGHSTLFYFQHTKAHKRTRVLIGRFHQSTRAGFLTLDKAREAALMLSAQHRPGDQGPSITPPMGAQTGPVPDAVVENPAVSLRALCEAYTEHLRANGQSSARQVANAFKLYVLSHPLAAKAANALSMQEAGSFLRALVNAGKGHTAMQLRSYLHAAYEMAVTSQGDAYAPEAMCAMGITHNPIKDTKPLSKYSKARTRHLNEKEMGGLLRRLTAQVRDDDQSSRGMSARAVLLNVRLAGQRGMQLMSVPMTDADLDRTPAPSVLLHDAKGARDVARPHLLLVEGPAQRHLRWFHARSDRLGSRWLFASVDPTVHIRQGDLSKCVNGIANDMLRTGESQTMFQFSDLRRTAETLLIYLRVGKETRARLLSHGLSGVQDTNYVMWDFMEEKREALRRWNVYLDWLMQEDPALPFSRDGLHQLP